MAYIFFDESVLAFILELKPRKFHYHKESNTLVTVYWCKWHFRCPIPANTGVGYCLFVFGSFHNLRSDKLIGLTLSFYTNRTFVAGAQT